VRTLLALALLALAAACGDSRAHVDATAGSSTVRAPLAAPATVPTAIVIDDFGDTTRLDAPARRIVSLSPSTTEILFALGAGDRLVGRTHWDLYPDSARLVPDLGDGLRPNVEAVLAARPDLVVLYASNDNRDAARAFRAAGIVTVSLKSDRIAHFAPTVTTLGQLTGRADAARTVVDSVSRTLAAVRAATANLVRPTVFWPLWDEPLYAVAGGSFLNDLLDVAGGRNIFAVLPQPSPAVSKEDVLRRDPDVVLVGPRAARRYRTAPEWRSLAAVRTGRVLVYDTAVVARPGVRLGEAAASLARLLHPASFP
jgi:iron complex transport system substrate-binding protein